MKISNTAKTLIINVILYTIIIVTSYFFISNDMKKSVIYGVILGGVFSIIKVLLLEDSINKSVMYSSKGAEAYMRSTYMLRYFLTGAVLFLPATNSNIDLFGTIIGVIGLQFAVYISKIPKLNYYN